eukprot:2056205-Rhodomonas_salina.2
MAAQDRADLVCNVPRAHSRAAGAVPHWQPSLLHANAVSARTCIGMQYFTCSGLCVRLVCLQSALLVQ